MENMSSSLKKYLFKNNLTEMPKCGCGKELKWRNNISKLTKYCGAGCDYSKITKKGNVKNSFIKKYGVDNPFKDKDTKIKIKNTIIEKYGVDNPSKSNIIKDKKTKTYLKNFGVTHYSKTDEYKVKVINTTYERYGVSNYSQTEEFRENIRDNIEDIRHKYENTTYERYGVSNYSQTEEYRGIRLGNILKDVRFSFHNNDVHFKCEKCDNSSILNRSLIHNRKRLNLEYCLICNPIGYSNTSQYHKQIVQFLFDKNIINVEQNNRTILNGKEIDIFLPDYNIGIEFNGLYWHSEECGKDKEYHISKTKLANEKGIKLIHIFEDEWIYKQEIVKSRLLNLLKQTPNKIYGRKCIIKELTNNECKEFLIKNHLQGYTSATNNIGLFYNNELVSLMTFGKRKITGKNTLELIRFCNKINTNVIGSASKLFKYFMYKYKPEELISYADVRWSGLNENSTIYNKIGFKLKHVSQPNYWYVKGVNKYHRYNFRKDKLIKDGFDPNKTEREIMSERGYNKIWDCGNLVFTFNQALSKVYTENINNTIISDDVINSIDSFLL
jgi:hypothetical protein